MMVCVTHYSRSPHWIWHDFPTVGRCQSCHDGSGISVDAAEGDQDGRKPARADPATGADRRAALARLRRGPSARGRDGRQVSRPTSTSLALGSFTPRCRGPAGRSQLQRGEGVPTQWPTGTATGPCHRSSGEAACAHSSRSSLPSTPPHPQSTV